MTPRRKGCFIVLGLMAVLLVGVMFFFGRTKSIATPYLGAYSFPDGRYVFISPRDGETLRYRLMDGESGALRPSGGDTYAAGPGWSGDDPTEVTITFDPVSGGTSPGLVRRRDGEELEARRMNLPEIEGSFESHGLSLRAKLVLPEGSGPFPAVVFVHGSGRDSAVEGYYNPYLFAAHGVAGLVYDKRGTGASEGQYNQNFHLLSDDTAAAVAWLRAQPGIDSDSIHLAGYSQGGWIAPLAATKVSVRSLLICYGPMVSPQAEDRWGYVYALKEAGFGEEVIHEVDEINQLVGAIMDRGEDRWEELREALARVEGEPWYDTLGESDSVLGLVSSNRFPWWTLRLFAWWMNRGPEPFIDRLYDPVSTMEALDIPSLWILGAEDSSMPTEWTIRELERLRERGRPIEIEVFPGAEHGILLFEEDEDGRRYLGYPPAYLPLQVEWVKSQRGHQTSKGEAIQPETPGSPVARRPSASSDEADDLAG